MTVQTSSRVRLLQAATTAAASFLLSSCGHLDHEYRLRFWENCRISSELALYKKRKHQPVSKHEAVNMADEAVYQAQGFGDADFRLGVSLCDLGDALKAEHKNQQSEDAYKKAVAVMEKTESREMEARNACQKSGKKDERDRDEMLRLLAREDLANTLSHLADLYAMQERFPEAASCFAKAANIYQSMVGYNQWTVEDCPMGQELVQCLLGLAQVSIALKNNDTACKAYNRALLIAVASNCPEFSLREIRDSYLKLLQQLGQNAQAFRLIADEKYIENTSKGTEAMLKHDHATAEKYYREAYIHAKNSIFTQRRLMRALYNLQSVFAVESEKEPDKEIAKKKSWEMEQSFNEANSYMRSRQLLYDKDFDKMLTGQAEHYIITNRGEMAAALLDQQLRYRYAHYAPTSMQICETLAMKGQAELQCHNIQAAEQSAKLSYDTIVANLMTNRRAINAMQKTGDLMADLKHLDEAEVLYQRIYELESKSLEPTDPRIAGYKANLFVLYWKFERHDKAMRTVNELLEILKKGSPAQRAQAIPYIIFIQSYALARGWYDIAEPLTVVGKSILQKELAGVPLDAMGQANWTMGLEKLEKHFGHKF